MDRVNADLASGIGNLVSRTLSMISKYRSGGIPEGRIAEENYIHARRAGIDPDGQDIVSFVAHARDEFLRRFDNFEFSQALEIAWSIIGRIDKMISDSKPWELVKDERQNQTLDAVLYRAAESLRWLAVLLQPVMPESAARIYSTLGRGDNIAEVDPTSLEWGGLEASLKTSASEAVFPRLDKNKIMSEIKERTGAHASRLQTPHKASGAEPSDGVAADATGRVALQSGDDFITIEDFLKVELRVGEIKVAEAVSNADKLLRFEVDLGEEKPRQILAGLAEYYAPEKLIGRKVVVV
ncbi:MAG: methionine--tRNA ligase, partial [Pyrinomonadaceae bacterium]